MDPFFVGHDDVSPIYPGTDPDPWSITGDLLLGSGTPGPDGIPGNIGVLRINGGSDVTNTTGQVGVANGSSGTVDLSGAGSTWTNTHSLFVGVSGTGTVTTSGGANLWIGDTATPSLPGSIVVSDTSALTANGGLLVVQNGSTLSNGGNAYLGDKVGRFGTAQVTGPGSNWTNSGVMVIGRDGTGTLNISAGGNVSNWRVIIGSFGIGVATVTGSGSTLTNSSEVFSVGSSGSGTLHISAGGAVSSLVGTIANSGDGLGSPNTGIGVATVTGPGSIWTNSWTLRVGENGSGTLNISAGGTVSSNTGIIGNSTGVATVTGSGSTWTNTSVLFVGRKGTGTLNILAGGTVSSTSGYIADITDSTGVATVTGTGSTWTNSRALYVGNDGTGTLNIENGGSVHVGNAAAAGATAGWLTMSDASNTNGDGDAGHLYVQNGGTLTHGSMAVLGDQAGEYGYAIVTGTGSTWTNTGEMQVGRDGTGMLRIEAQGALTNGLGRIGTNAGSTGTATVTGAGSTWTNSVQSLEVGSYGNGTLLVSAGGAVSSPAGNVGLFGGSTGMVTVQGSGSAWNVAPGNLVIGQFGNGTMQVLDGGNVSDTNGFIAFAPGTTGSVLISGAGSKWSSAASLYVGGSNSGARGTGELTIEDGGEVQVANTLRVWDTGTLNLGPGGLVTTGQMIVSANADLGFQLDGTTPGLIDVAGLLNLNGNLNITLSNAFAPIEGSSFDLFDFTSLSGTFATINLPTLGAGLAWDATLLYTAGEIAVVSAPVVPGDTDGDGDVDDSDLGTSFANYTGPVGAAGGKTFADGDTDGDGDVDDSDLGTSFAGYTGPLSPTNVPEPASLVLLALGGLVATRRLRA